VTATPHQEDKTPCLIPHQFATELAGIALDDEECVTYKDSGNLFYDYTNMQIRADLRVYTSKNYKLPENLTVWLDFNEGVAYYLNRDSEKCKTSTIKKKLKSPELPDDSDYRGTYLIGSQAIEKWAFEGSKKKKGDSMRDLVSLTEGTCFLVKHIVFNETSSDSNPAYMQFYWNFVPKLPLNYFDVPEACQNAHRTHQHEDPDILNHMELLRLEF